MRIKIGDVFSVNISESEKKFFQYIAVDSTQLNSDVIRSFKKKYLINEVVEIESILDDEVDFYAHCVIKFGLKMKLWEKVGNSNKTGELKNILFRGSRDSGCKSGEQIKFSTDWYVWKINDKDFTSVGKLEGDNIKAELGLVVNPYDIIEKMRTGSFRFFYPDYK